MTAPPAAATKPKPPVLGIFASANYRRFFVGQIVSVIGTWTFNTYLLWVMLEQGRSGQQIGLVVSLTLLPLVLVTPFGGSIADRFDRKTVITACYAASVVVVGALAVSQLRWSENILVLALAAASLNTLGAIEAPARQVFLFDLVGFEALQPAIILTGVTFNLGRLAGPAIAAAIIASGHADAVVVLNGASFVVAALAAVSIARSGLDPLGPMPVPGWRNALREMARVPTLVLVIGVFAVVGTFALNDAISVPLLSNAVFSADASVLGVLLGSVAVGSLAGGALMLLAPPASPRLLAIVLVAFGVTNVIYGQLRNVGVLAVVGVLLGIGATSVIVLTQTLVQTLSPDSVRGRSMALFFTLLFGTYVIGAPLLGWAADTRGASGPFLVATLGCIIGISLLVFVPASLARRVAPHDDDEESPALAGEGPDQGPGLPNG